MKKRTKLKRVLWKLRMTQTELAKLSNVSNGTISQLANGRIEPSVKTARKIEKALGMEIWESIYNEEEIKSIKPRRKKKEIKKLNIPVKYFDKNIPIELFKDEHLIFIKLIMNDIITFRDLSKRNLTKIKGLGNKSINVIEEIINSYFEKTRN